MIDINNPTNEDESATSYDDLLKEVRTRVADFQKSTAREYIPRMYTELRNENFGMTPEDARDRIEKDCVGIWLKRTILDALPDETKDPKKQKAGRLRQKKLNSAAFTAAPEPNREILLDANGNTTYDNPTLREKNVGFLKKQPEDNNGVNSFNAVKEPNSVTSATSECPNCEELTFKIGELEQALRKATSLKKASDIPHSSSEYGEDIIRHFEFELLLEDVRKHIQTNFNVNKIKDKIWFNATLNIRSGKVVAANVGRFPQTKQEKQVEQP